MEGEVATAAVLGVLHQDEVREALAERESAQPREIDLAVDVGIDKEEVRLAQQGSGMRDAARGLERLALA
jgi:hypothetical protein